MDDELKVESHGKDLAGKDLTAANLTRANLTGANLISSNVTDVIGAPCNRRPQTNSWS